MNTVNLTIDNNDIKLAQEICEMISNENIRNRAMANAVAASIAGKFFDNKKYNVDFESGLHNIGRVLEDIDISDIYINGNYFDVRVFFNDDEICVPVSHFKDNLLPIVYMFIKIDSDLSNATVIGFANPEKINTDNPINGYYYIYPNELESFNDIEPLILTTTDAEINDKDIFLYLDNKLDDISSLCSDLLKSKKGRLKLAKAIKAQNIFKFISISNNYKSINETNLAQDLIDLESKDINDNSNSNELLTDESGNLDLLYSQQNDELILEEDNISSTEINTDAKDSNMVQLDETKEDTDNTGLDFIEDNSSTYTTVASPSINEQEDIFEELTNIDESEIEENIDNNTPTQIEALFNNENLQENVTEDVSNNTNKNYSYKKERKASPVGFVLIILLSLAALLYWGYTKYLPSPISEESISTDISTDTNKQNITDTSNNINEVAMPIETVNSASVINNAKNETVSTSIPMIEQNLDASILVSNLKVEWEVPSSYTSNAAAKRYLTKIGKIIQLNLKTELLLLNKPPITNKIGVAIKYNTSSHKFETTGITMSSGENIVDQVVLQTVNDALAMNLNINTDSFAKLQGNPILIIHL